MAAGLPSHAVRVDPLANATVDAANATVAEVVLDTPAGRVTVKCPPCPAVSGGGGWLDLVLEFVKPTAAALGGALAAVLVGRRRRKKP